MHTTCTHEHHPRKPVHHPLKIYSGTSCWWEMNRMYQRIRSYRVCRGLLQWKNIGFGIRRVIFFNCHRQNVWPIGKPTLFDPISLFSCSIRGKNWLNYRLTTPFLKLTPLGNPDSTTQIRAKFTNFAKFSKTNRKSIPYRNIGRIWHLRGFVNLSAVKSGCLKVQLFKIVWYQKNAHIP